MIVGCQEQPEKGDNSAASKQFEESDKKIGGFLDILDDQKADKEVQRKVLCIDFPRVYKEEYMPSFNKLDIPPSQKAGLDDLKKSTDYYSQKLGITCD